MLPDRSVVVSRLEPHNGFVLGGAALYVLVPGDTKGLVRVLCVVGATSACKRFVVARPLSQG